MQNDVDTTPTKAGTSEDAASLLKSVSYNIVFALPAAIAALIAGLFVLRLFEITLIGLGMYKWQYTYLFPPEKELTATGWAIAYGGTAVFLLGFWACHLLGLRPLAKELGFRVVAPVSVLAYAGFIALLVYLVILALRAVYVCC